MGSGLGLGLGLGSGLGLGLGLRFQGGDGTVDGAARRGTVVGEEDEGALEGDQLVRVRGEG